MEENKYWLVGCDFYYTYTPNKPRIRVFNANGVLLYDFANIRHRNDLQEQLELCTRVVHEFIYEQGKKEVNLKKKKKPISNLITKLGLITDQGMYNKYVQKYGHLKFFIER